MKLYIFYPLLFILGCSGENVSINGPSGKNGDGGSDGINGEAGSNGSDGLNGSDGKDGKDGTDNHIIKTWKCDFSKAPFGTDAITATTCTDTTVKVEIWYYAAETASGDVFVRSGVDWSSNVSNRTGHSSSYFWKSGSYEAKNGNNWLLENVCSSGTISAAASGNWSFALNRTTNQVIVKYIDSDVRGGELQFIENCTN